MDYQKMWRKFRDRAVIGNWLDISYQQRQQLATLMSNIEIEEAREYQKKKDNGEGIVCGEGENNSEEDREAKKVLDDIFGDNLVKTVDRLREVISSEDNTMVFVDSDLVISEDLERLAKEKDIMLGKVKCISGSIKIPFPFRTE